ncbi:MAG: peptidoglycan editing factor PgeF [Alphaproteobacteria bacterium]|nr:peptidoglycan editing factor PgeF [Alphaproteobacteria bacterium]
MILRSPLLESIPNLHHAFFTREGGVSDGIYSSLNGGLGSSDDPAHVAENRRRMAAQLGVRPEYFLSLHQTHSAHALVVEDISAWAGGATRPEADAMVSRVPGLALGISTADCGPVLFVDPDSRVIGAAHAGWKGALNGVLEATVAAMEGLGADRSRILTSIGPLIRQENYEVGPEFRTLFAAADGGNAVFFKEAARDGHARFDLAGFIRNRLQRIGILRIDDCGLDIYGDARFFSYRRSRHQNEPDYGRHIHAIALQP